MGVAYTDDEWRGSETLLVTDCDQEVLYGCLAEVGLDWDTNGGGWCGWDRVLTEEEWAQVLKAEQIATPPV